MKNYYEILGVNENASKEDIKKAYRNLSKKYHPDVNPENREAEERFKEISEANSILGDPVKKSQYDTKRSIEESSKYGNFSFDDWIKNFTDGEFKSGFGRSHFRKERSSGFNTRTIDTKHLDIYKIIEIKLKDLATDDPVDIIYTKIELDHNTAKTKEIQKTIRLKLNLRKKHIEISERNGEYFIRIRLKKLGSEGLYERMNIITGRPEGFMIIGDLHIDIKIINENKIIIEDNNLIQEIDVPLHKILFKKEKIKVSTIFNKTYEAEISSPKYLNKLKFNIKDQGFIKRDGTLGSYIIKFNIIPPDTSKLTNRELKTLKDILTKNFQE